MQFVKMNNIIFGTDLKQKSQSITATQPHPSNPVDDSGEIEDVNDFGYEADDIDDE